MTDNKSVIFSLDNLNMEYISHDENEEIENGAILKCCDRWTDAILRSWLPHFNFEMIESVKRWITCEAYIAEGLYLKVWVS
jgi:hypothetical protein